MSEGLLGFFAQQKKIYPKRVWGKYRIIKWIVMIVTLGIYYLSPFLRWDRGPNAPDQAILIDMQNSKAYFFFIEIWPQEVYYLTGILILAAVVLFFVTSMLGRVWCGYFCFQTVWTDLFVWIERIVQGDRAYRMRLDNMSWFKFEKLSKKLITHLSWISVGILTGGAWVFYFNDAPTLLEQIMHGNVPSEVLGWVMALAGSTYLMAGFAREQVCIYMCPYARFQSAMFDKDTLIIGYDDERGEPRGKHKKGDSWEGKGHCVACTACVQVCPMGIDIRDGLQMECIACGLCVDACNNIMDNLGLERGLVRYDTENNIELRAKGDAERNHRSHILRPRTFYYMGILSIVAGVMLYGLINRAVLELHVLHDRNPLFTMLSDGTVRNGYDVKILNKTHDDKIYRLEIEGLEGASFKLQSGTEMTAESIPVFANSVGHFRMFLTAPKPAEGREEINLRITDVATGESDDYDSIFISKR